MAGETLYSGVSSLLPDAYEAALMWAQENLVMPQAVATFTNMRGKVPRKFTEYSAGTVIDSIAEATDVTFQTFDYASLATLTPKEVASGYFIGDARLESELDTIDIMSDLVQHIQQNVFGTVEANLAAHLASLTAGTVGTAGSALTWQNIYNARAILRANGIPGPYNVVLHEYQYIDLATAANIAGIASAGPLRIRDDIQNTYYVGSTGDMNFYTIGLTAITAGTAVKGGIFNPMAIGFDVRRPFRLEMERDASKRGLEIIQSIIYASGVVRADWGVTLLSDASAPS